MFQNLKNKILMIEIIDLTVRIEPKIYDVQLLFILQVRNILLSCIYNASLQKCQNRK